MSSFINSDGYSDNSKMPTGFIPARSKSQVQSLTNSNLNTKQSHSPSPEPFDELVIENIPGLEAYLDPDEISLLYESFSNSTDFQPFHSSIDNLQQNNDIVVEQIQEFGSIIQEGINYPIIPPTATKQFLAPSMKKCEIEANHRFCDKDTKEIIKDIPNLFALKPINKP